MECINCNITFDLAFPLTARISTRFFMTEAILDSVYNIASQPVFLSSYHVISLFIKLHSRAMEDITVSTREQSYSTRTNSCPCLPPMCTASQYLTASDRWAAQTLRRWLRMEDTHAGHQLCQQPPSITWVSWSNGSCQVRCMWLCSAHDTFWLYYLSMDRSTFLSSRHFFLLFF